MMVVVNSIEMPINKINKFVECKRRFIDDMNIYAVRYVTMGAISRVLNRFMDGFNTNSSISTDISESFIISWDKDVVLKLATLFYENLMKQGIPDDAIQYTKILIEKILYELEQLALTKMVEAKG